MIPEVQTPPFRLAIFDESVFIDATNHHIQRNIEIVSSQKPLLLLEPKAVVESSTTVLQDTQDSQQVRQAHSQHTRVQKVESPRFHGSAQSRNASFEQRPGKTLSECVTKVTDSAPRGRRSTAGQKPEVDSVSLQSQTPQTDSEEESDENLKFAVALAATQGHKQDHKVV
jgi:hypothetical protein